MKKFIIGAIFGILLATTTSVFADDIKDSVSALIGKQVEGTFPLHINGKKTEKDAIVIDGSSYIPVRSAGELFGYDVDFKENQIILQTKVAEGNKDKMLVQIREILERGKRNVTDEEVNAAFNTEGNTAVEKTRNYYDNIMKAVDEASEARKKEIQEQFEAERKAEEEKKAQTKTTN